MRATNPTRWPGGWRAEATDVTHPKPALALDVPPLALDAKAAAIDRLRRECDRFLAIEPSPAGRTLDLLHQTVVAMHSFATAVTACEEAGATPRAPADAGGELAGFDGEAAKVSRDTTSLALLVEAEAA
jgi:hypothetical protein